MPTPTGRARPGDVYAIPLQPRLYVIAKVVYVSRLFRNVIGIAIASRLFTDTHQPVEYPIDDPLLYTAQVCAKEDWLFLRTESVTESEVSRTLRIVAVDLYLGDERLREATREEQRLLPHMSVAGCGAVILALRRRFALPHVPAL